MQPARAAFVLVIVLIAGACAPQSVSREIDLLEDAGRPPEGPRPPDASVPGLDGGARPAAAVDARLPDALGDGVFRALDTGPVAPDTGAGVRIDPPAVVAPDAGLEAPAGPGALLVVGSVMPLSPDDEQLRVRLEGNGLTVRLAADSGPATLATGASLVVISGTSLGDNVAAKYAAVPIPVLCLEPAVLASMRLTGDGDNAQGNTTGTQITITAQHPIVAGQTGTVAVTSGAVNFGWGLPAESAARIATVAGMANRYAIFAYEKGALLVGMPATPAPARRSVLFIHTMVSPRLTPAGWQIFDATVSWTLGR